MGYSQDYDPIFSNALAPAMHRTVSFRVSTEMSGLSVGEFDEENPYFYSRWANPTCQMLEEKLSAMEGGERALVFSSGMAAVTGLLLTLLKSGDHLVASNVCYPGVSEFLHGMLRRYDVEIVPVDTSDTAAVANAVTANTKAIFIETPANPVLRLTDISEAALIAKNANIPLIVDSTFATPVATNPLSLGADYVVHSLTKYIGGHGDALGGAVIGGRSAIARLRREAMVHLGAVLDPFAAWLFLRSLTTLEARVRAHSANAMILAEHLEKHPRVKRVIYPGLPTHPQFHLAQRQMRVSGGVVSFQAKDSPGFIKNIPDRSNLISYAVSIGKPSSLVYYIATDDINRHSLHLSAPELEKYREWAGDGIFRLSVGLEDPGLLRDELDALLAP